ncbi:tRNA: m1A22 methyltransferase [Spiroplasma corruscae]|uniref:tRNA: m1A22 methyltransferase n=1 Tax=Spiroplasma corruscae TaxID=216934 RepID=A0A222ENH6_9MOLU|nr:class I SAM-dependent methyltransferase [Spiroplasma corruscae]ASP28056.1 tRNA: m1A22 methyltransferase [Spiroplasma corruscae]
MSFLTPRLFALAKLVNDEDIVADIGTDHAYLPIYLAKDRKAKKIFATDIADGPLNIAKNNIRSFGVEDKVEIIKSDGINWTLNKDVNINVCIISGMGSTTMLKILENDNKNIDSYVFCTNTNISKIREWAKVNKYFIESEQIVLDNDLLYEIIKINKFAGSKVANKKDIIFGPILRKSSDDLFLKKWMVEEENLLKLLLQVPKKGKRYKEILKYKKIVSNLLKKGIKKND